MGRKEYCDRVLSVLRRVTPGEREAIRAELDAHMEDHICDLLELGYEESLAEERTMALMGDPEEVGRELDKQYPPRWLILSRVAAVALTLTLLGAFLGLPTLSALFSSFQARMAPWSDISDSWAEQINHTMDLKQEIGSDVLRVLGSGTIQAAEDETMVKILWCQYDQNPFGYCSNLQVVFRDCRGEDLLGGSGSHRNAGAAYVLRRVPVQAGDPYVMMICERHGERYEIQIPLVWEGSR